MSEPVKLKPRRAASGDPQAYRLVEEAVHLVRQASISDYVWYYAGAVPWVLGLLFFWGYTTWFAPSSAELAWGALGLTLLFGWLKVCQSQFAWRLLAMRRGGVPGAFRLRELPTLLLRQIREHALGLLVLPFAAFLTFPLGFAWTYYQTLTVSGDAASNDSKDAWEQMRLWPMQTHVGMAILSMLGLVGWLNVAGAYFLVPWLLNRLVGVDNVFGLSGWTFLNSTFLASTFACTWLLVDPLVKSYHVLRYFYGRSVSSGHDLREAFLRSGLQRKVLGLGLLLLLAGAASDSLSAKGPTEAAPNSTATQRAPETRNAGRDQTWFAVKDEPAVSGAELRRSIHESLRQGDYDWRLRPKKTALEEEKDGAVLSFMKTGLAMIRSMYHSVERAFQRFSRWIDRVFGLDKDKKKTGEGGGGAGPARAGAGAFWVRVGIYVLGALLLGVLGWLCVVIARQARRNSVKRLHASPVVLGPSVPDLEDEKVHAAQLPSEGWLQLAREKLGTREWRLAFRALYLAQLARLGEQGCLTLARHKTNLEYELELRRRVPGRNELLDTFGRRRRGFDAVWYGRAEAAEPELRDWLAELGGRGGAA